MTTEKYDTNNPESQSHPDTGSFTITHFSEDPAGFTLRPRRRIPTSERAELGRRVVPDDKMTVLAGALRRDVITGYNQVKAAHRAWQDAQAARSEQADELEKQYRELHRKYRERKVGICSIELAEDGALTYDVASITFPAYEILSDRYSPEMGELGALTGLSVALITSDNRLIIQHRAAAKRKLDDSSMSPGNAIYSGIPGTSASGMLDQTYTRVESGQYEAATVDTGFVKAGILKEVGEELGLLPSKIENLRVVGVVQDGVKPHNEISLVGSINLTATEIQEQARTSTLNKNLAEYDLEEKFLDIEATPEAVVVLLTEMKCPLSPTHIASMIVVGHTMVLERDGKEAARSWREQTEREARRNYEEINAIVREYYLRYPDELSRVPERYWGKKYVPKRDAQGYSPAYTPSEQGLPPLEDELVRTGLIPETRRRVSEGLLFDVDGVLSDPRDKYVKHPEILDVIKEKLQAGEPVCLNTGRSTSWVMENIVEHMPNMDKRAFANLIIVGEKGGSWVIFDTDGHSQHGFAESLAIPDDVKAGVRKLIDEKYADIMSYDETKQTMISVEMINGADLSEFATRQIELCSDLEELLAQSGQAGIYHIDPTTIATDIESQHAGKALGSDRFIEFLNMRGVVVDQYRAFGDSASDLAMADELVRRGKQVEFIYVGDKIGSLKPKAEYPILNIGGFDDGLKTYLQRG